MYNEEQREKIENWDEEDEGDEDMPDQEPPNNNFVEPYDVWKEMSMIQQLTEKLDLLDERELNSWEQQDENEI